MFSWSALTDSLFARPPGPSAARIGNLPVPEGRPKISLPQAFVSRGAFHSDRVAMSASIFANWPRPANAPGRCIHPAIGNPTPSADLPCHFHLGSTSPGNACARTPGLVRPARPGSAPATACRMAGRAGSSRRGRRTPRRTRNEWRQRAVAEKTARSRPNDRTRVAASDRNQSLLLTRPRAVRMMIVADAGEGLIHDDGIGERISMIHCAC